MSSAHVYRLLLGAVFNIYLARQLGIDHFGLYGASLALVGTVFSFARLGLEIPAKRETARNPTLLSSYFGTAVVIQICISFPTTLIATYLIAVLFGVSTPVVIGLMTLWIVVTAISSMLGSALQSIRVIPVLILNSQQ